MGRSNGEVSGGRAALLDPVETALYFAIGA